MLDYNIIEEALKEHKESVEKPNKNKSAKQVLFENLLHEMYPMAYAEPRKTKYTRMADLIRLLQDALWKIQDGCSYSKSNPEDKDIYDTIQQTYESSIQSILDRLQEIWQTDDSSYDDEETEEEVTDEEGPDFSQITLQLQPEEVVTSPQNKKYKVVEINGDTTRVEEVDSGEFWLVETKSVEKWKNRK